MIRQEEIKIRAFPGFEHSKSIRVPNSREFNLVLILSLLHLPLGLLLYNVGSIAILHPIAAFLIGTKWAWQKNIRMDRVVLAAAYIVGSEILWRMAQIPIFWEFGKFTSIAIMVIALIRRGNYRIPKLPLVYFTALLPACILTLIEVDITAARSSFSSILSGPLFLAVSCVFFSNIKLTPTQLRRLFVAAVIPLISAACAALFYTVSLEEITFTGESNFATSGGFGPNQVSSMLGFGAFAAVLCLILFKNTTRLKSYFAVVAILCAAQSVLTFSRGGIYNAVAAILMIALWEFRKPAEAIRRFAPVVIPAIIFVVFVFPFLNNFTGGSLQERFEDTGTTQRSDIVDSDIQIFLENPIFGVGIGGAYEYREKFLDHKAMSHTEFSRLLSEHGMFGLVAIVLLIAMVVINVKRQRSDGGRVLVIGAFTWCVMFMLNAGTRLGAPSFMWGLTFVTICSSLSNKNAQRWRNAP